MKLKSSILFVSNRIQQIRNSSNPSQWRYVSSEQNPADDPSRGLSIDEFLRRDRWKLGPDFLWKTEDKWPDQSTLLQENLPEQKIDIQRHSCLAVLCESPHFLDDLISRYSSWQRLLRVCAWILRFKDLISPIKSEYTATVTKPRSSCVTKTYNLSIVKRNIKGRNADNFLSSTQIL